MPQEEPKVELIAEEPPPQDPSQQIVDVPITPAPVTPAAPAAPAPVVQKPNESNEDLLRRLKAAENQAYGNRRILEGIQKQIADTEALLRTPPPAPKAPGPDFWSDVDPRAKGEIQRMITEEAQRLLNEREAKTQMADAQKQAEDVMKTSIDKVFTRYPALKDDNSPETELWLEIINEHPEFLSNPHGPILAMTEFEDRAPAAGLRISPVRATAPRQPSPVIKGRGNGSLPVSRQVPANTVQMTKEEVDYCTRNGIDPVRYKQTQKQLETGGGVEA